MLTPNLNMTICIPCYNDLNGLKRTLESIFVELGEQNSGVLHIVVGLNDCAFVASDICFETVFNSSAELHFCKTDRYLEYDDSIKFVASRVKTDFCAFLGCGEVALAGLHDALLKFQNTKTDFGVLPVASKHPVRSSTISISGSFWSPVPCGIFNKVLSGHVFRTSSLQFVLKNNPFIAFEWAHIEMALMVQGNSHLTPQVFSKPVILRSNASRGWWTKSDIYKQYIEYCDLLLGYHYRYKNLKYVDDELRKAYSIRLLLMIIQARGNNMKEVPMFFSNWVKRNDNGIFWRYILQAALIMPATLANRLMAIVNWRLERR
jgi:hypothetical protein